MLVGVVLTLFLVIVELDRVGLTELQPTPDRTDVRAAGPGTVAGRRAAHPALRRAALHRQRALGEPQDRRRRRQPPRHRACSSLDATALGRLSVTVIDEVRRAASASSPSEASTLWFAGLPPQAMATAEQLPRWHELRDAGHVHDSALAAVRAYLSVNQTGDRD